MDIKKALQRNDVISYTLTVLIIFAIISGVIKIIRPRNN